MMHRNGRGRTKPSRHWTPDECWWCPSKWFAGSQFSRWVREFRRYWGWFEA